MRILVFLIICLGPYLHTSDVANAQSWVVDNVKQPAHFSYNGQPWTKIVKGNSLPSGSWINTGSKGRVLLKRGKEIIQFKPKTMAAVGKTDRAGQKTLVMQQFGSLLLDVETRKKKHVTVKTPFLAAVVKGTRFTVDVGESSSSLSVERGVVEVTDERRGLQTDVRSNQSISIRKDSNTGLRVKGTGTKSPVKTVKKGKPVIEAKPVRKGILSAIFRSSKNKSGNSNGRKEFDNSSSGDTRNSKNISISSNNNGGGNGNGNNGNGNGNSGNKSSSNGNSSSNNGGGNGNGNNGNGNGNSGNKSSSNGNSSSNNGGGNGNGNNGNGNGNSGNKSSSNGNSSSNSGGGNGNGNNGNGNGNSGNKSSSNGNSSSNNGGGNGNGNNGNGNGNSGSNNGGGNGNGNSGNSNGKGKK